MSTEISSQKEFDRLIAGEPALLAYFSPGTCSVCKALKPKVAELIQSEFPKMKMGIVNTIALPEVAGKYRVFAVPTILVFFEGRETIRKIRNVGINELRAEISRPYLAMFS